MIGVDQLILSYGFDEGDLAVEHVVVLNSTLDSYAFNDLVFIFVFKTSLCDCCRLFVSGQLYVSNKLCWLFILDGTKLVEYTLESLQ